MIDYPVEMVLKTWNASEINVELLAIDHAFMVLNLK